MQKCIKEDFPQLLELPQLRRHIGGCFQSVCKAAVSRIFRRYQGKQTWRNPFKVELCENSKKSYFQTSVLRVSLPFGVCVNFIFLQGYWRVWIIVGKKLWRIEIVYFCQVACTILIIITCSTAKKYVIVVFLSWSKRLSSHFSKLISQLTEAAL